MSGGYLGNGYRTHPRQASSQRRPQMRAAIFKAPRSIEVGDRPDASISEPTDAVVRVALACVCGSDLWYYRGDSEFEPGPIGHEFVGVVEDVGADVQDIGRD